MLGTWRFISFIICFAIAPLFLTRWSLLTWHLPFRTLPHRCPHLLTSHFQLTDLNTILIVSLGKLVWCTPRKTRSTVWVSQDTNIWKCHSVACIYFLLPSSNCRQDWCSWGGAGITVYEVVWCGVWTVLGLNPSDKGKKFFCSFPEAKHLGQEWQLTSI